MDAKTFLTSNSVLAEKYIEQFFEKEKKKARKIDKSLINYLDSLETYIKGGKKARFALTILGYQIAGGKNINEVIPAAFAVELMHNSLVIHDDFVDRDNLRRGKETIHTIYSKKHGEHYGASMAIIIADLGIFLANELLANLGFQSKNVQHAIAVFNKLLLNTGFGELMDIDFDYKKDVNWEDILKLRIYKTAHYTFVMPLSVGATLGGGDKDLLTNLKKYGEPVGLAFQSRDDVLGVFGDPQETGKSNDADIKEGKKTLLYLKVLEMASKTDSAFVKRWYGNKALDSKKMQQIKEIIRTSGALKYSEETSLEFVKKAKKYLAKITLNRDYQETLASLGDYMILRNK